MSSTSLLGTRRISFCGTTDGNAETDFDNSKKLWLKQGINHVQDPVLVFYADYYAAIVISIKNQIMDDMNGRCDACPLPFERITKLQEDVHRCVIFCQLLCFIVPFFTSSDTKEIAWSRSFIRFSLEVLVWS